MPGRGSVELANAYINIVPSTKDIGPAVKAALGDVGKQSANVGKSMGDKISGMLGKTLKVGAAGAGVAAGGVLAGSIAKGMGRLTSIDAAEKKLQGLGNTAQDVEGIMDNALSAVEGTAFGMGEAATVASQVVASGIKPGKELERVLTTVGDVAAITGDSMEGMGMIFGSVAARGKLMGDDLLQLRSRGLPVMDILAESLGKTTEEVEQMASRGEISFDIFETAMREKMGGAAQAMGDTFQGSIANVGAAMGRFGEQLMKPFFDNSPKVISATRSMFNEMTDAVKPISAEMSEKLAPVMGSIAGVIENRVAPALGSAAGAVGEFILKVTDKAIDSDIWSRLGDSFAKLGNLAGEIWPDVSKLIESFGTIGANVSVAVWEALVDVLNALAPLISTVLVPLVEQVANFASANPGAIQAIATAFIGLKGVSAVAGPMGTAVTSVKNLSGAAKFAKSAVSKGGGLAGSLVELAGASKNANPAIAGLSKGVGSGINVFGRMSGVVSKVGGVLGNLGKTLLSGLRMVNPWVLGITAVAGALTWFFTKTELGQQIWQGLMDKLQQAWGWLQTTFAPVFDWLGNKMGVAWDFAKSKVGEFAEGLQGFWETWISPVWESMKTNAQIMWDLLVMAFDGVKSAFSALGEGVSWVWTNVVQPVWGAFGEFAQLLLSGLQPVFTAIGEAFKGIGTAIQWTWDTIISPVLGIVREMFGLLADVLTGNFDNIGNRFSAMGEHLSTIVNGVIQGAMDLFKSIIQKVQDAWTVFKDHVSRMVDAVKNKINDMVNGFRAMPGKIKGAFSNAGSWLVDAGKSIIRGLVDGIKSMAGAVGDAVRAVVPDSMERFVPGLHFGGLVGFARGGVLPDVPGVPRSQRDPILGYSREKKMPIARVEPGEFVVNREATRKNLPLLAAINGGRDLGRYGDFGLPGYANGGLVSAKELLAFAGGQSVNGKKAPFSLEGARYVWGGGLLGNWGDCSGAMSGLAAFVVGMALQGRKFATANEGSVLSRMGFSRGTSPGKNAFEIGFFNGGPYGGHTSGTIYGDGGQATNVEMGGGRGNGQIGGRAAGSRHSQYTDRYWIALKGASEAALDAGEVVSTSVKGLRTSTGSIIDWGTASGLADQWAKDEHKRRQLRRFTAGVYDTGGILNHDSIAINLSGKKERVLDPRMTVAFEKFVDSIPGLSASMDGFGARLDDSDTWMERAAGVFGTHVAQALEGGTIGAYLSSLSASESVGLIDQVGSLFGATSINNIFGGVAKAYDGLEDAAVTQVDAADALRQAEENLARVRAEAAAQAGGTPEEVEAATQAVTDAENEYAAAKNTVAAAAKASGQAQIAMAIEVAEMVIKVAKWIDSKVHDVFAGLASAWTSVGEMYAAVSEFVQMTGKAREAVSGLRIDWAMAQIELAAAFRNLRLAQVDGMKGQLEAARTVAEAEAAFEQARRNDLRLSMAQYEDLSLMYDKFRWAAKTGVEGSLNDMAAWSDSTKALYEKLLAAQVGLDLARQQGLEKELEATYKIALAALDLGDVTRNLQVASEKLAVLSGQAFGFDQVGATVGERYAKLAAERLELQANNAKLSTWINPANWGAMGDARRRIAQIDEEMRALEQRDEFRDVSADLRAETEKMARRAGAMGFFGAGDQVAGMVRNSRLGDAARAVDQAKFENSLIDLKAEQAETRAKLERGLLEVEHRNKIDPLRADIDALEMRKASHEAMADYWRTSPDSPMVREAIKALADQQREASSKMRETAKPVVIQVPGDKQALTVDEIAGVIESINAQVDGVEMRLDVMERKSKPDALAVATARRF